MRVYIAAPFFNDDQICVVKEIESELEKAGIEYYSPRLEGVIKDMTKDEVEKNSKRIYSANVGNIFNCNVLLAVVDGKDPGTIFELGYAAAINDFTVIKKTLISLSTENKPVNVMLRHCVKAHLLGTNRVGELMKAIRDSGSVPESFDSFPVVNT